jgi:hypothetical protein
MQAFGFICDYSGAVTLDSAFVATKGDSTAATTQTISAYISVGGSAGGIVYVDQFGFNQWWPNAFVGYNPIAATKILTSATIDGVLRTTTATSLGWGMVNKI